MALNHTHDVLNTTTNDETNNKATKTKTAKEMEENKEQGDLLDGRTLLEAQALLIMMITRMKIKG
jgi:hypothetical protein